MNWNALTADIRSPSRATARPSGIGSANRPLRAGRSRTGCAKSGQNYTVRKVKLEGVAPEGESPYECGTHMGLIREDTNAMLSVVSPEWQPAQNSDAYAFLAPLMEAGFAKLDTAGVLYSGKRCFVLVKTKEGFTLPGGDDNSGYILCQISHQYGIADLVLPVSIRVVCANTLQFALDAKTHAQLNAGRFVHRAKTAFSVEKANALIAAYRLGLGEYAEKAKFLSARQATPEQTRAYVNKVFKLHELSDGTAQEKSQRKEHNEKVVAKLLETIEKQPGAEMSRGSWWSKFHGVTFFEDHGKYSDGQQEAIASKLYGTSSVRKTRALEVAIEMAS